MRNKTFDLGKVLRFIVAGAIGVIAYYATLYGLTEYLCVWYILSAVIGFVLNTGLNFVLQKFWTFQNKETHMVGRQLAQYVVMTIFFLICNTVFLYFLVEYIRMWYIGAQVILTILISCLSFIISGRIFTNKESCPTSQNRG